MTRPGWPVAVPPGQENAVLTRVARDTHSLLNNGLTINENMFAVLATFNLTHCVEFGIPPGIMKNNARPLFFQPMYTSTDATSRTPALGVQSVDILNYNRADGRGRLTVRFAPPSNMLGVTKAANQTGMGLTANQITWQTTEYIQGTFAYTTAGVFTIPASGILKVACDINIVASAIAGDWYGVYFNNSTTGKRWAQCRVGAAVGSTTRLNTSDEFPVTAGETYTVQVFQGGTARDVEWNSTTQNTRLGLSYVAPPINYSAYVTGILWGG